MACAALMPAARSRARVCSSRRRSSSARSRASSSARVPRSASRRSSAASRRSSVRSSASIRSPRRVSSASRWPPRSTAGGTASATPVTGTSGAAAAGSAGAEQQRGGHEASRQHDRCDDDAHCPVLSLGTGAMPGPGLVVVVTGRAAGPRRRLGGSAVRPGRTSAGAGEGGGRRAQARGAELPDGRVVVGCRKGAVCWGFAAPEGRTFAAPDSSAGGAGAQSEPCRAGDAGRPSRRQPSRSKRRTAW